VKSNPISGAHNVQRYGFTELSPGTRGDSDVPLVTYGAATCFFIPSLTFIVSYLFMAFGVSFG